MIASDIHSPAIRHAGRDVLSLALMDARNRSLRWCAAFEAAAGLPSSAEFDPPLWLIGHLAWFQEAWIARNVQRQRGVRCDPRGTRLASIDPRADDRCDPAATSRQARWASPPPDAQTLRDYLAATMEVTLELLESAADSDDALYFYRLALFHEDRCTEALAEIAQATGVAPPAGLLREAAAGAAREPLLFPATHWALGAASDGGGFVFDNEKWAHQVALPEFEIDAQPVSWAQYTEFTEDGGYDDARWWSADGWPWLQREGRRVPRHVEQMRAGVLQRRFGAVQRVPLAQPVSHVAWYEADAWCRWAGRRLPVEAEWDLAAHSGAPRGFRWGGVREWTAGSLRAWPGFTPDPWSVIPPSVFGAHKAVRGASWATPARLRDPALRSALPPQHDLAFTGFRSCAG